ncbi:MAG: helix-turn-helix transcriptional regulator [Clostridiales bacterium]|nr:helix-turn-helix transcriptional regulator [Clostridiales bacterium]
MQFNEKLKELRAKKGVSQSELAESIYVSRSAVAKWENGLGLPSNESLRLLSEYFEVSKEELYSDAPTEKVIVQKNQIISRSRKLLILISTVCAIAFTAIIVLLGLSLTYTPNKKEADRVITGIRGTLYSAAKVYDEDADDWVTSHTVRNRVLSQRKASISADSPNWEKYILAVGEYTLCVNPSPGEYSGQPFAITADNILIKYNSEVFDIVLAQAYSDGRPQIEYVFTAKKPCINEEIMLYHVKHGEEITEGSLPSSVMIIAVLPSEENA